MKAWLVYIEFNDGSVEGVVFSSYEDAVSAYVSEEEGASLAVQWGDLYGDTEETVRIKKVEI